MNRNEWIWVAIRIFGIYLLVLAITAIPDLIYGAVSSYMYWSAQKSSAGFEGKDWAAINTIMQQSSATLAFSFVSGLARVILYSVIGYYLLRKGNFLFKVISHQQPPQPS